MKIIKFEYYKIIYKKTVWLMLLMLLALNTYLYISQQSKVFLPKAYNAIEKDYSELPIDIALSKATSGDNELAALGTITSLRAQGASESIINEQVSSMLQAVHSPLGYDTLLAKYKDTKYMQNTEFLREYSYSFNLIKEQLLYITGYPDYINSMKEKAETMKSVTIFNKPGTFAYRNIVKTTSDFQHLKNITLQVGDQFGIVSATKFNITDLFIMAIIFIICVYLFLQEAENGLIGLVKSNVNGRLPVIISKLCVLTGMVTIISFIFYGTNLLLARHIYGFGDMSRYIQSMSFFRDCNVLMTVKEYLILWLCTKIVVAAITSLIFALFFTMLSNAKTIALGLGMFLGINYLNYRFIHPVSNVNVLKYINLFAFFDVSKLYGEYSNLNILGYPTEKIIVSISALTVSLIVVLILTILSFVRLDINAGQFLVDILNRLTRRKGKISGNTNLFFHETFKIVITGKAFLILALAMIISYNNSDFKSLLLDKDESAYKGYIDTLAGPFTNEKKGFIEEEQKRFDGIPMKLKQLNDSYEKGEINKSELNQNINSIALLSGKQKGFERLKKQYEYLLKLQKEKNIKGSFINEISSDYIFNNQNRDLLNGVLFSFLLILCLCNNFPMDYKKGASVTLSCTTHGRLKLFSFKYVISYILTLLMIAIIYLPQYLNLIRQYSLGDLHAPIQSIEVYGNLNINISILGFIILINLLQILSALTIANLIILISMYVRKYSIVVFIGVIMFVLPFLMSLFGNSSINQLTIVNGFTLFNSFAGNYTVLSNSMYFSVLLVISTLSVLVGALKHTNKI